MDDEDHDKISETAGMISSLTSFFYENISTELHSLFKRIEQEADFRNCPSRRQQIRYCAGQLKWKDTKLSWQIIGVWFNISRQTAQRQYKLSLLEPKPVGRPPILDDFLTSKLVAYVTTHFEQKEPVTLADRRKICKLFITLFITFLL